MSYESTKDLLCSAQRGGYAIGAFNIENAEMARAVIEAAQEQEAPVILQTTPSTLRYLPPECYVALVKALAQKAGVPVALHLDHGSSFALCAQAFLAGYTSIMIDGSALPFAQNMALTQKVTELCSCGNIPVEGEIGAIGGKEDDTQSQGVYTSPPEAKVFWEETGVNSLAVAVGTAHGVYGKAPVLQYDLIAEIAGQVAVPLVLHGASGLSVQQVRESIKNGICKVNFATELRFAYSGGVREGLGAQVFDPKIYGKTGMQRVRTLVQEKISLCLGR